LATSSDGIHFTKHPGNPIIAEPPQSLGYRDFRDPYVWREADTYYLIIGSAVKDVGGTALLYRSKDLLTWEYRKRLMVGDRETSGVFWEMPIFIRLEDYHALIVCEVPGRASYWVGTWKDETFTPITTAPRRLELFNHLLSPTPLHKGGQVIAMGIIPDERHPQECWTAGWAHHYSLPRVLSADASGHIFQVHFEGIDAWCVPMTSLSNIALEEGKITTLDGVSGESMRLHIKLKRGDSQSVSLLLRRSPNDREKTVIRYQWEIGKLVLDRTESSLNSRVKRNVEETTYFPKITDAITLTAFLDQSVLEVFIDERAAFATRIYPTLRSSDGVALSCSGLGAIAEQVSWARIDQPGHRGSN
jgi:sucrose-6-phosphate hydrolase SacC (GH32 family)